MKPEIKAAWVAALRSGEYPQGAGGLNVAGRYCCLGVLCDLASKQGLGEWATAGTISQPFVTAEEEDCRHYEYEYTPFSIQEWAGLSGGNPIVNSQSLADRNDKGVPFAEIADLIEAYL